MSLRIVLYLMATLVFSGLIRPATTTDRYNFQQAYLDYKDALKTLERTQQLWDQGLVAIRELEHTRLSVERCRLELQKTFTTFLAINPDIQVEKTVKTRSADGGLALEIALINHTRIDWTELGLQPTDIQAIIDRPADDWNTVHNVMISIVNSDGTLIGQPYTRRIEHFSPEERITCRFQLLENTDIVTIRLESGSYSREVKIKPTVSEEFNRILIQADHFSQGAALGTEVVYLLHFETFTRPETAYSYQIQGLPEEINISLRDAAKQSTVNKIDFSTTEKTAELELHLTLPERSRSIPLDKSLPFSLKLYPSRVTVPGSSAQTAGQSVGGISLELMVNAATLIGSRSSNLLATTSGGAPFTLPVNVRNEGQKRIFHPQLDVELPASWTADTVSLPQSLEPGESREATVRVTPPAGVAEGDYNVTVRAYCFDGPNRIEANDLLFRVENQVMRSDRTQYLFGGLLVCLLLAVVIVAVRFSRK